SLLLGFFFFFMTCFFIIKPSISLITLGSQLGFDYIRDNFFVNASLRSLVFGSNNIAYLAQNYIVPLLWFYSIYLIGSKNKFNIFLFYFIVISLVVFNLAYAGRFYIYFALIIFYLKNVLEGKGFINFLKKYTPFGVVAFFVSLVILSLRRNEDELATNSNEFMKLLEY